MRTRGAGSPHRVGARSSRRVPGLLAAGGLLAAWLAGCSVAPEARVVEAPAVAAATATATPSASPSSPPSRPDATPPPGAAADAPVTETDAVALAAALTAALADGRAGDWAGYFATGALRGAQRDWFAAVQATPMTVREMHPLVLTPARPGRDAELTIGFRHQVAGADLVPTVERYRYLLARAGSGELRVTEVDGGGRLEVDHPQLWDLVATDVRVTEQLVLLHPADQQEAVVEALPRLEAAAAQVLADFPVPGVERLVVTAAPPDAVDKVFGGDVEEVLGFATGVPAAPTVEEHDGMVVLPSERQIVARTVMDLEYLGWESWDGTAPADPDAQSPLLRHEGMHALMALAEPTARPARWVSEGLAGWYEEGADPQGQSLTLEYRRSLLAASGLPEGLPPADAHEFHGRDQGLNYALAASFFEYLEHRHGAEATRAVGVALHGVSGRDSAVSRVLQEHLGSDLGAVEAAWLDWLAAQQ